MIEVQNLDPSPRRCFPEAEELLPKDQGDVQGDNPDAPAVQGDAPEAISTERRGRFSNQ